MADVEFGTSDVSAMLAEMDRQEKEGKFQSQYWSPKKEGITKIRFLPQLSSFNESLFFRKHKVHYINGRPYMCLSQTLTDKNGKLHESENCPLCKKATQIYSVSVKGTEDWDLAGSLRAKDRYVSRIIIRGNQNEKGEDIEYKPEFYEFGSKILEMIKAALQSGEYGNPFDLKAGRDFNLTKKGQKKNTDYSGSMFAVNQTPIFTDATKLKALLAELPSMNYDQLVEFETAETLTKVMNEYLNGEEETPNEPAVPAAPSDDIFGDSFSLGIAPKSTPSGENLMDDELDELIKGI